MTVALVSTVPGAVGVLEGHFNNVAAANPALNVGVFVGPPVGQNVPNNHLAICGYPVNDGEMVVGWLGKFNAIPGSLYLKGEDYSLACHLQTWSGEVDPISRITEAWTLLSGVMTELTLSAAAIGGSGSLTPSGSWEISNVGNPHSGPFATGGGWGMVLTFDIHVWLVQMQSPSS